MLYYIYSGHYFLTELAHNRRKEVFAMFEDDYLLRLIKEMVRTVLKLLFHIDFKAVSYTHLTLPTICSV